MQAYVADFPPRAPGETSEHFHEGAEFLFLLAGELAIQFEGEEHELREGDSVYFDSSEPHRYRGLAEAGARAVVITFPPRI